MTTYPTRVLEHFRNPRNQRRMADADVSTEGANPLCGDRVRIDVQLADGLLREVTFTADACVLCVASASLLTEHTRGMPVAAAAALDDEIAHSLIGTPVPPGRARCVTLPLDTLRRGLRESVVGGEGHLTR